MRIRRDPGMGGYRNFLRARRGRRGEQDAELLGVLPGDYVIIPSERGWQAVHGPSGGVLGPVRTLRKLAAAIDRDNWQTPARTAGGTSIAIRADSRPVRPW